MAPKEDNHTTVNQGLDNGATRRPRRPHLPAADRMDELQDFYDFSPVGHLTIDRNANILGANLTVSMMMKTTLAEMNGQSFYDHVHWDDRDTFYFYLRSLFTDKRPQACELRLQNEDGKMIHVVLEGILAEDRKGRQVCRSVLMDITARMRAEEALQKANDELEKRVEERVAELQNLNADLRGEIEKRKKFENDLRMKGETLLREQRQRKYLANRLIETLERERQQMATTLHDEVGQILTTINMDLDFVKLQTPQRADTVVDEIDKIQERIRKSMDYISDLSRDLRSHILDDLGLVPSLKSMSRNIERRSQTGCHLFTKDIPEQLSENKAVAIYRIIQEAVRNCLRHACAKNIFINLAKKGPFILSTIEDDGIGFEYDQISAEKGGRGKLGIMIMRERAEQAGGEFRVESRPGHGTQVIVDIPIK